MCIVLTALLLVEHSVEGVRQGGDTSAYLFFYYLDDILEKVDS